MPTAPEITTSSLTTPWPTPEDVLAELHRALGISSADLPGDTRILGADPVTPGVHRYGDATAAAMAALGTEIRALWYQRTGRVMDAEVSVTDAACQLMSVLGTTVSGVPIFTQGDQALVRLTDFYRTRDDRMIDICFMYPHFRDLVCEILDCAPVHERVAAAVSRWNSFDLEQRISARGGAAAVVRSAGEWAAHPVGKLLGDRPLIEIERIADSAPEPFAIPATGPQLPLTGVRVLDNGHVLAGPLAARMLAEVGAEVLHISHPLRPEAFVTHCEANIGKRSAYCDITDPDHSRKFFELLRTADIYVNSWRSLDRKGLSPRELAERRPGIIVVEFSAFGHDGQWAGRGGFDFQACSATGLSADEGLPGMPVRPPTLLLTDYLAPILASAAAVEALRRRAADGGSYRIHIALSRVSMWVKSLGMFARERVADVPMRRPTDLAAQFAIAHGPYGTTRYLPTLIKYSDIEPAPLHGAEPLGAAPLAWSS